MAALCAPCISSIFGPSAAVVTAGVVQKVGLSKKKKSNTKKKKSKNKKKQKGGSGYETQEEFDEMNRMPNYDDIQSKCNQYLSDGFKNLLKKNIPMNELKKYAEESFKIKVDCEKNKFSCDDCEAFYNMTLKLKQLPPPVPKKALTPNIVKKGKKLSEKNRFILQSTINNLDRKRLRSQKRSRKLSQSLIKRSQRSNKLSKLRKTKSAPKGGCNKRKTKRK